MACQGRVVFFLSDIIQIPGYFHLPPLGTYYAQIQQVENKGAGRSTCAKLYRPSLEVAHLTSAYIPLARTQSQEDCKGDCNSNIRRFGNTVKLCAKEEKKRELGGQKAERFKFMWILFFLFHSSCLSLFWSTNSQCKKHCTPKFSYL